MDPFLKAEIEEIYEKILALDNQKKYAEVKELLHQLLSKNISPMMRAMAHLNVSVMEEKMGNIPAAIIAVEEARRVAPENMQLFLWIEQVNLLDCHGRWSEALELCCRIANSPHATPAQKKFYQKKIDDISKFQETGKKPGGGLFGGFGKEKEKLRPQQNARIDPDGNVTWL